MINLGFIGAGRMANAHAEALKNSADCRLLGVYDPERTAAEKFAKERACGKIYHSLAELAADPSLDGVLVCNFTDQHHDTLVELLNAGKKSIFCEKALVRKLEDGEDILRRVKKAKAAVMVGHHRRHIAGYARLKQLIDAGGLGRPLMAKVAVCCAGYARQWGDFFADFERSGGVTLDMMSHPIDQLNWYFGKPTRACGQSLMFDRSLALPVDYLSGTVTYANGVICNIDGSWQRYGVGYDKLEVYGDKGTAIFDGSDILHIYRPGEHTELLVGNPPPYTAQMRHFVDMITKGTPPKATLVDGFNAVRVALALIESAKSNKTVEVA